MKRLIILFCIFIISINLFAQTSFDSTKQLPMMKGVTIKEDGTIITKEDRITTFNSYSGFDALAKTYGLKLQTFTYKNTKYILLNEGDYRYFLIRSEDWKTTLYKNVSNVNIIPVCAKLKYDDLIERNLDYLLTEFEKNKDSSSDLVLFTFYDIDTKSVRFLSSIFFDDYNYQTSFPDNYEYPAELPKNYYFSISDNSFIDFFNATISEDISNVITKYEYDNFHLIENYDKYEDVSWYDSSEHYEIFSKDNISFKFYIGKLSSGNKILRMSLKTMGCDKYYDCIESVVFINKNNERISFDIPYDNTKYSYSHAKFDVLLKLNDKNYIDLEKLKEILSGEQVEIMLSFSESYRRSYFVNKAKTNELLFMINEYEKME